MIEGGGDFPDELSRTSIAKADRHRLVAATVLIAIGRMAEIVADAADVRAAADGIADAADAVEAGWWRPGSRTRRAGRGKTLSSRHGFARIHTDRTGHKFIGPRRISRGLFAVFGEERDSGRRIPTSRKRREKWGTQLEASCIGPSSGVTRYCERLRFLRMTRIKFQDEREGSLSTRAAPLGGTMYEVILKRFEQGRRSENF